MCWLWIVLAALGGCLLGMIAMAACAVAGASYAIIASRKNAGLPL